MKSKFGSILLLVIAIAAGFVLSPSANAGPSGYHLVKTIPLVGNGGWDYLTMDSVSRRLFVARGTHVTVVNVDSGKVVGDIPNLNGIHGVAIDHKTGHGFISDGRSNLVAVFSLSSLRKVGEIPVGQGPDAIIFDPATSRVFTFDGKGKTATAIDSKTDKVIGTIALPGKPEFPIADGAGHIYDNIEDKSEIVAINSRTLKVEHTWPIAPGEEPSGIAMDTLTRRLFSVCHNQMMTVMNVDTGKVVATVLIGNGPDAADFDSHDKLAFSSNGQDGTLTLVREVSANRYTASGGDSYKKGSKDNGVRHRHWAHIHGDGESASAGSRRYATHAPLRARYVCATRVWEVTYPPGPRRYATHAPLRARYVCATRVWEVTYPPGPLMLPLA